MLKESQCECSVNESENVPMITEAMTNYKEVLENLGYKLSDHGPYWRTNALYRAGDNTTALQIHKDSGV